MQSTVLRQARSVGPVKPKDYNNEWELTDVAATVATVQRCMAWSVGATDCQQMR